MEASPLIKAHDHARAASKATHTSDTTVAINEHTRAAGEFANAAKTTTSAEALRTLKLLEQHHQRLSELLKIPLEQPTSQTSTENDSQQDDEKDMPASGNGSPDVNSKSGSPPVGSSEKSMQPMPTLSRQNRYPSRDLGASIASNLASARGIRNKFRSQPLSPTVSNTEAPGNMEQARRSNTSKSSMQSVLEHSDSGVAGSPERVSKRSNSGQRDVSFTDPADDLTGASAEEGFSKFYNAFGSIINRISAPLAFAGLPLITEEVNEEASQPAEPSAQKRKLKSSPSSSAEPDLSKLYSRATLRAISREVHSANDSFYVVPTSGHTKSYASILTYADKEKRRMEASFHGDAGDSIEDPDDEDFVDAKESQAPGSPGLRKRMGRSRSEKEMATVIEELYTENKSLKDAIDKVSKRLHAFESMSQNSGMRLAESMRSIRPGSPLPPGSKAGSAEDDLKRKNIELERKLEEMEREQAKLKANLGRYREKWEQLKAGAKARRAGSALGGTETPEDGTRSPR